MRPVGRAARVTGPTPLRSRSTGRSTRFVAPFSDDERLGSLELDTTTFDRSVFQPRLDDVLTGTTTLMTLADLGDTDANRRRLYELNAACSADIPDRGPFHNWDDYVRLRLAVPTFRSTWRRRRARRRHLGRNVGDVRPS